MIICFCVTCMILYTTYIPCTITAVLDRKCYERYGHYYLDQFVQINGNGNAYIECGKVINCDTSPCNFEFSIGDSYFCSLTKDNIYLLPDDPLKLIAKITCLLILCSYILLFLIGNSYDEYNKLS